MHVCLNSSFNLVIYFYYVRLRSRKLAIECQVFPDRYRKFVKIKCYKFLNVDFYLKFWKFPIWILWTASLFVLGHSQLHTTQIEVCIYQLCRFLKKITVLPKFFTTVVILMQVLNVNSSVNFVQLFTKNKEI